MTGLCSDSVNERGGTQSKICDAAEIRPVPTRLPMRVYMRVGGVASDEALNCGLDSAQAAGAEVAGELKACMNRWKGAGLNLETGKVDYQRLSRSELIDEYQPLAAALRHFDPGALATDDERKAFWINVYNAMLIHGVIAYGARKSLWEIRGAFERIAYVIGGYRYSLDDIEHGILRGNKAHFILPGPRFSRGDPRRRHAVDMVDARIHFALVCGANSCPPIGIYEAAKLNAQLDIAARSFINSGGVIVDRPQLTAALSRVFQWHSPDFGGKWMGLGNRSPVLRAIAPYITDDDLRQFIFDKLAVLKISYQSYDWALNV